MKVAPFHSKIRGLAVEDHWHNNNECEIGHSVPLGDRRSGEGRFCRQCPICKAMNQPLSKMACW
jgi:hypothetical protein